MKNDVERFNWQFMSQGDQSVKFETISLVIPCFNEESTVEKFYQRAKDVAISLRLYKIEYIFVNDGSTDDTERILNNLSERDQQVKVLHLAQNRGHQIALTAGMDYASGDIIITIDADLQHPPENIGEMVSKIEQGYDIVHTQRRHRIGDNWFNFYFVCCRSGILL